MFVSPNLEHVQQLIPGCFGVSWDLKLVDDALCFLAAVLQLNLLTRPHAVVTQTLGNAPFQRLAGLCTAHDDGVVAFEALAQCLVVVRTGMQVVGAGRFGCDAHGRVAVRA